jgi:hypothetical protein
MEVDGVKGIDEGPAAAEFDAVSSNVIRLPSHSVPPTMTLTSSLTKAKLPSDSVGVTEPEAEAAA